MTGGVAKTEQSVDGPILQGRQTPDVETPEEQPPIAPAAVLCLAAVIFAVLGLNHWKEVPVTTSASVIEFDNLVTLTAPPSRFANLVASLEKLGKGLQRNSAINSPLNPSLEQQFTPAPRPPTSFKVANLPAMVFNEVQGDQWSMPKVSFPQMIAPDMHKTYSDDWKPMISWRKTSNGESFLPVARVRCGGLSPQAVARRVDRFDVLINQFARKYEVDPNLVKAIITRESCFDQSAVSHVGAIGLMQLMPETARWLKVKNPAKAEANLSGGVRYFASLHKEFGTLELALAAYNAGPGNVRRYGGIPPFRETQSYVKTVLGFYRRYSAADSFVSS